MYLEVGILVMFKDWESGIASSSTDFEERYGTSIHMCDLRKNWKLLLQPFAIFEEVRSVILVEIVPPFRRIGIESVLLFISTLLEGLVGKAFQGR